ncbi:MAG TPA: hypothetical protein VN651_03070 [Gemmatimonadaceae bacterium]|nr:hypothetical protein [Gemmatimonadaceae bacterium]
MPGVDRAHGWLEYAVESGGGAATTADWWVYLEPTVAEASSWRRGLRPTSDGKPRERWNEWSRLTESIASPRAVRGIVRGAMGKEQSGVRVALLDLGRGDAAPTASNGRLVATTTTDSTGRFRLIGLHDD